MLRSQTLLRTTSISPLTPERKVSAMRRSFLLPFLALLSIPVPTFAQSMGVIYYAPHNTPATYRVNGDGTGQGLVDNSVYRIAPTRRSDYPGGRQFLWKSRLAVTDASGSRPYCDVMSWDLTGATKQLTAFAGPTYVYSYLVSRSNDDASSFFSFFVYDSSSGTSSLCRANVTPDQIADQAFQPVVPGDPRLEVIATWPQLFDYRWDGTGTRVYYLDDRVTGQGRLRVKTVGVGLTPDNDPVLFDASLTGAHPGGVAASPTSSQIVLRCTTFDRRGKVITDGFVSLDAANPAGWSWLITTGSSGLVSFMSDPCFSPDGSGLCFGARGPVTVTVHNKRSTTYVPGVYKMPAGGGGFFLLTESPQGQGDLPPYGWTW
jgi:hypothetical protein